MVVARSRSLGGSLSPSGAIRTQIEIGKPGLPEHAYAKALGLELNAAQLRFEREKRFPLTYCGEYLCDVYLDFLVADVLVVEIKSVEHLAPIHHSQTLNYMRISGTHAGLLINFNVPILKSGIRRKIL